MIKTMYDKIPTDPRKLETWLSFAELDGERARDCRRMMTDLRMGLTIALRSGDRKQITAARDKAVRVAEMWQGF